MRLAGFVTNFVAAFTGESRWRRLSSQIFGTQNPGTHGSNSNE